MGRKSVIGVNEGKIEWMREVRLGNRYMLPHESVPNISFYKGDLQTCPESHIHMSQVFLRQAFLFNAYVNLLSFTIHRYCHITSMLSLIAITSYLILYQARHWYDLLECDVASLLSVFAKLWFVISVIHFLLVNIKCDTTSHHFC